MALFNRNRNQIDQVPLEVQEYYQAERRERRGMAWLLAAGTLAATVALAAALFFGGKWLYRTVAHRDNKKPTTAQKTNQGSQNTQPSGNQAGGTPTDSSGTAGSPTGTSSASTDTPSPTPAPGPSPSPATSASQPAASPSTTAVTGSTQATGRLVNTGPEHVVTSFIVVTAGASALHYAYVTRRARR